MIYYFMTIAINIVKRHFFFTNLQSNSAFAFIFPNYGNSAIGIRINIIYIITGNIFGVNDIDSITYTYG